MFFQEQEGDYRDMNEVPSPHHASKKSIMARIGIWILVVVVVAVAGWGAVRYGSALWGRWGREETNAYQAVFLSNGQVYFGKLSRERSQYPVLRDIYYLQVTQPPQLIQPDETSPANINIVKLGQELHGPEDEMRINRDTILFIEDLKPDSRVVQAIEQIKNR